MKTIPLGNSSLTTSPIGYGCWRITGNLETGEVTEERATHGAKAVVAAFEAGYRLFDLADVYADGLAETIFGQVLKQVSGMREQITLVTKCGIRKKGDGAPNAPYRYDSSAAYIKSACQNSLERLGVETIDLFLIHRPDFLMDYEEIAKAFEELKNEGKVRYFGVSNFHPLQLAALQKACPMPLIANQVEINLWKLDFFQNGTLEQCVTDKILPMAWSPLAGGKLASSGQIDLKAPDHAKKAKIRDTQDDIARHRGVSRSVVALSWLLRHPAGILPIIGTANAERITDATKACDCELSREEWYRLMEAANGQRLP